MRRPDQPQLARLIAGAAAGFVATVPMTAVMLAEGILLPWYPPRRIPPRKITMNVADALDVEHELSEPERNAATAVAHFGYGTAMGAAYGLLSRRLPGPPVARGIAWGLLVYALSYFGLLPALRLHESAARKSARWNLLMIVDHVVWGATLGATFQPRLPNRPLMQQAAAVRAPSEAADSAVVAPAEAARRRR